MPAIDYDTIDLSMFMMVMLPPWIVASVALFLYCKDKLTWTTGNGNSDF